MNKTRKIMSLGIVLVSVLTLVACSSSSKTSSSASSSESTTEVSSTGSESKGLLDKVKETVSSSDFNPQDVSDETIESIKTYEDYLTMYEKITQDYYDQSEAVLTQKGIADRSSFEALKTSTSQALEEQKKQYGPLKKAPIQGKDEIIQMLKDYRDELKSYVDILAAN